MDGGIGDFIKAHSNKIEDKRTVEIITDPKTKKEKVLIEVRRRSGLEDGSIKEETTFDLKAYDCGCASQGRKNLGGIDYKGNIVCDKHFYRCSRCHRPVSILTVCSKNGITYCKWCGFIRTIFPKRR